MLDPIVAKGVSAILTRAFKYRIPMDEFDELELDPEDKEEAQIIANEMIEILVRRSATIDMTWEALDILHSVMQELEEESFQEETMGLNGFEY